MDIAFCFNLDQQFFKDRCGYKTDSYEPGVFYGYIYTEIHLDNKPKAKSSLTESDLRLRDLLNNETIETDVFVATTGVASHIMLNDSSSVKLDYYGTTYNIQIELLSYEADEIEQKRHPQYKELGIARCKMKILDKIPETVLPQNKLVYLQKQGPQWMSIAKFCLNHPGEYYYSERQKFFSSKPSNLRELIMIYDADRGFDNDIPHSEQVMLDPLFYVNHNNPITAEFAKRLFYGDFSE